jgi:hypothetical protein
MEHGLKKSVMTPKIFQYNLIFTIGLVVSLLAGAVFLFVFKAKPELTENIVLDSYEGECLSVKKETLKYNETGIRFQFPKNTEGYQWLQHNFGEVQIFIAQIGGKMVPVIAKENPKGKKIVVRVINVEKASSFWESSGIAKLEANKQIIPQAECVLIQQKNEFSIFMFGVAICCFLYLSVGFGIRIFQLMRLEKSNPSEYNDYYERLGGK